MSAHADAKLFDELSDALVNALAEGGSSTLLVKDGRRGECYFLHDACDRMDGVVDVTVYHITSKSEFMHRLRERISEEEIDVWDEDVHEAVWEILERYKLVNFDTY